ncbi:hypothetical protein Q1695_004597 [Nippostrongylus brasiliensis]|nr:hypothetical protein Q1695_004597 [Nippostrongylus brasiliensis]
MAVGQGVDVSKKLKAAIKAKLEELGVYVDDELPEYIMCTSKFVEWLFDLFERLQTVGSKTDLHGAEKPPKESSKEHVKERDRKKETESVGTSKRDDRKESRSHDSSHRHTESESKKREAEKEKEREREREKERERARQMEKAKEKEREERAKEERLREERAKEADRQERIREQERLKSRSEAQRVRETARPSRRAAKECKSRSRSRSRTWSDDEFEQEVEDRSKKVASSVIAQRQLAASPEPVKVSSQVHVMRKVKPATSEIEKKTMKAGSSMFLKAMNQASVSAGYGASLVEKKKSGAHAPAKKSPLKNRISRPNIVELDSDGENARDGSEVIVGDEPRDRSGGPQITVTLKGAKDHIGANVRKANLKRRKERGDGDAKNSAVVVVPEKRSRAVELDAESSDGVESPSIRKWDGQIKLDEEDTTDDDEAKIDAVLADARGVSAPMDEDGEVPPTRQLSRGNSWSGYSASPSHQTSAPTTNYIPTPLAKEDAHFTTVTKIPERCRFWPACRQGENCSYTHPTKQCINFPHCSFGSRCLYIHPPCRFDRKCVNPNCPYTHGKIAAAAAVPLAVVAPQVSQPLPTSTPLPKPEPPKVLPDVPLSTEPNPVPSLSSLTPCLFGNKCKKPNCAFKHPKACHYGTSCMNASCYFYHPPQPKTSIGALSAKYKWSASSATA